MLGATDARHYIRVSRNVYRFAPARLRSEDLQRVHGKDERIAVAVFADAVRFYAQLIVNAAM